MKHGQVVLSDLDRKYELHFLTPEYFPVISPAPLLKFRVQGQKDLEVVQSNLLFLLHYPGCYQAELIIKIYIFLSFSLN